MDDLKKKVEALLFSSGRRMALEELSRLCHASMEEVKSALEELKKEYEQKDSSLMIVEEGNFWKLTTKEHYLDVVKKIVTETELTRSLMETLAVIAFKYPILQSEVIKIRTNKAYDHLKELEEMGYITRQKHGRTNLIKLTDKFFTYFSLSREELKDKFRDFGSLAEAIEKKEEEIEQAKKQYEEKAKAAKEQKEKLGQLIVVEEEEMPPEAPAQIIEDKQMLGPLEVVEELPEQQKTEEVEEAEEALAKGKTKRAKKHIFEAGEGKEDKEKAPKKARTEEKLPPEIARRVEQRVEEILHPPKEEEEYPEIEQPEEIGAEQPEEKAEEEEAQKEEKEKEEELSEDLFSPEQPPVQSTEQPGEGGEDFFAEEPEKEPPEEESAEEEEAASEEASEELSEESEEPEETGSEEELEEESKKKLEEESKKEKKDEGS